MILRDFYLINWIFIHSQIYNGLSTEGQLLEKFCNTSHPEPLSSTSNELTLQFHSDGDSSDMGFQIHYTVVDGIPGCGGTFTASSGNGFFGVFFVFFCLYYLNETIFHG